MLTFLNLNFIYVFIYCETHLTTSIEDCQIRPGGNQNDLQCTVLEKSADQILDCGTAVGIFIKIVVLQRLSHPAESAP
jgi:hypothetical protein